MTSRDQMSAVITMWRCVHASRIEAVLPRNANPLHVHTLPHESLPVPVPVCAFQSLNTTTISDSNPHTATL